MRLAYHNYGAADKVAYAFTHNIPGVTTIKANEMRHVDFLANVATTPVDTAGPAAGADTFVPTCLFDCRGTLFVSMIQIDGINYNYCTAYRLNTDTPNTLRTPVCDIDNGSYMLLGEYGMPSTTIDVLTDRRVRHVQVDEVGYTYPVVRLQSQTVTLLYNATDVCGMSETCTQQATFGTVAACTNVV
jgi:hypothetical protein